MRNEISGELALVTGAGSGIGKALSLRLAQLGCDVILVGRTASKLEQTVSAIRTMGRMAFLQKCDLTNTDDLTALVRAVSKQHSKLDILVNNVGVLTTKRLEDTTTAELDAILLTNVRAPFILCRDFLPMLRKSKAAEIVNICSVVAHEGYPMQSAYGTSKHALLGMSKALAKEVYDEGIRVHVLSPGSVRTPMIAKCRPELANIPMIDTDDIADAFEYLLTHRTDAVIDEIRMHRSSKAPF